MARCGSWGPGGVGRWGGPGRPERDQHDPGAVGRRGRWQWTRPGPGRQLGFGFRHGLGRRVLHGEVTVQTQEGVKTLVMASGEVSALSKDAITAESLDGVETSFTLNGDTRQQIPQRARPER